MKQTTVVARANIITQFFIPRPTPCKISSFIHSAHERRIRKR